MIAFCLVGCSRTTKLPADDDAFMSYLQAVIGLATDLDKLKSKEDLAKALDAPPKPGATSATSKSKKDYFDDACLKLDGYKTAVKRLSSDKIKRLVEQNSDLVQKAKTISEKLKHNRGKAPQLFGTDWNRYWTAMQIDGVL